MPAVAYMFLHYFWLLHKETKVVEERICMYIKEYSSGRGGIETLSTYVRLCNAVLHFLYLKATLKQLKNGKVKTQTEFLMKIQDRFYYIFNSF